MPGPPPATSCTPPAASATASRPSIPDQNRASDRVPGTARNSLRLPSQLSIDPRITKDIHLAGSAHLQLIAEAFNLTNRSNVTSLSNDPLRRRP